jgi:hypothetical protein
MTNTHSHSKPTPKQLNALRRMAYATGGSFAYPTTFAEASSEIERLKETKRSGWADRRAEEKAVRSAVATARGGAARVRDEEVAGYGSTATWARREDSEAVDDE